MSTVYYQNIIKTNIIIFLFNTEPAVSSPFSLPFQNSRFPPQEFKIAEFIWVYNHLAKLRLGALDIQELPLLAARWIPHP